MLKRLLDNAINGLSLIAVAGLVSAFLSYCVSYGQFAQLDPYLMPSFSSVDLTTNFALLAIPLFSSIVVVILMSPFINDYVINEKPLDGGGHSSRKINLILLPIGLGLSGWWILSSDDKYLMYFRVGIIFVGFAIALLIRAHRKGNLRYRIESWKSAPFTALHGAGAMLMVIAFTLSNYGRHETTSRIRDYDESRLYLKAEASRGTKIVVLFAAQERAVIFDGRNVLILSSDDYAKIFTTPEADTFDKRTVWEKWGLLA